MTKSDQSPIMIMALAFVAAVLGAQANAQRSLQVPDQSRNDFLSLAQFNYMLRTETLPEVGFRSDYQDPGSDSLWRQSIEHAWLLVDSREKTEHSKFRRGNQGISQGPFSAFVLCDTTVGKQGQRAKEDIAIHLGCGDHMIVS